MSALPLFRTVKTTEQLIENIERLAAAKFKRFHWTVTSSKDEASHRSAMVTFVGTDRKAHPYTKLIKGDSLAHVLFLLDEYLTLVKNDTRTTSKIFR